jgi:hypothetical protein
MVTSPPQSRRAPEAGHRSRTYCSAGAVSGRARQAAVRGPEVTAVRIGRAPLRLLGASVPRINRRQQACELVDGRLAAAGRQHGQHVARPPAAAATAGSCPAQTLEAETSSSKLANRLVTHMDAKRAPAESREPCDRFDWNTKRDGGSDGSGRPSGREGSLLLRVEVALADVGDRVAKEHTFGAGWWGCDCTRPEDRSGPPADPRKAGAESYLSAQDWIQEPLAR